MGADRVGKGLRGRRRDPSENVLMNSPSSWGYNCRQNASETTFGFKGEKEELGWWEKKMKAARTPHQSSTSKRKERDSKHVRKELKEILSLQPSLCSRLLCALGVSWTFYVTKDEVLVKLWDPCTVLLRKQNRPKGCDGYTLSSIHSHRRSVSRKECIWCPSERKDSLGKSKQERS